MPPLTLTRRHHKYLDNLGSVMAFDLSLNEIGAVYHRQPYELKIRDRHRDVCEPRQVAFFIGMCHFEVPCTQVAEEFGHQHCNVLHGVKTVKNLYKTDKSFRRRMDTICQRIGLTTERLHQLINRKNNYRTIND